MTALCLWSGTLAGHDLWTRVRAAGRAGYTGLSVAPVELEAVVAAGEDRRLRAELARYRLRLACLDPVAAWLPEPVAAHPAHRVHASVSASRCLELAERFGIDLLNVIDVTWRPLPPEAGAHLAGFAARARRRGVRVAVEAQVYSAIPHLAAALALCRKAGPDVLLTVDAWHYFRDPANRVVELPAGAVGAVQLADGPAAPDADPVVASTTGRRLPGEGDFDLLALVGALTPLAPGCPIGPEVFTAPVPDAQVDAVAARALAATRRLMTRDRGVRHAVLATRRTP